MITNYIKLAWRILWRRKFFTFISLFGISFTLAVLMLFTSVFQAELSDEPPMGNNDELIVITNLTMTRHFFDTIPVIDSMAIESGMKYDTTFTTKSAGSSISSSDLSKTVLINHFSNIPSARVKSLIHINQYDIFVNNSKLSVDAVFSDASYWDIFNFRFIAGRPFDASEVEKNNPVMVVTENFAKAYFGNSIDVVGKEILMDGKTYQVIGLVATPRVSKAMGNSVSRDVFIPYSMIAEGYRENYYFGGYHAVFRVAEGKTLEQLKEDLHYATSQIPIDHPDNEGDYNEISIKPATMKEFFARSLLYHENPSTSLTIVTAILTSLLALFILLPLLNLINLNVSRIMDRAAEIGVRKAFGADQSNILSQFIFENVVLTLLGGAIGMLLAIAGIYLINDSGILGNTLLSFNIKFFISSLIICLIFGILSGIFPAYKMSKMNIVDALKQSQL